jgi:hypothetical protein
MRLPEYDVLRQRWDDYKQFHIPARYGHNPVVRFQSGEVLIITSKPNLQYEQHEYSQYNFALTSSTAGEYTSLLPDGTPCPQAWIMHKGVQYFLVDLDTKNVVRLSYKYMRDANVPAHMQTGAAGFLRPGGLPIGAPIAVYRPVTLTAQEKKWMSDLHALVGAHCSLNGLQRESWRDKLKFNRARMQQPVEQVAEQITANLSDVVAIWSNGVEFPREVEMHDYLMIK